MVGVIQKVDGEMIIKIKKCKVIKRIKIMMLGETLIIQKVNKMAGIENNPF